MIPMACRLAHRPTRKTATADPQPGLSIDKQVVSGEPMVAAGDTVTYSYLVTNIGNVTINTITISDDKVAPADLSCPSPVADALAPGDSITCSGVYIVTQADLDAGSVTNIASPNGIPTQGVLPPAPTDTVTVTSDPAPSLDIDKNVISGDPFSAEGDIVSYSYVVTNTGKCHDQQYCCCG